LAKVFGPLVACGQPLDPAAGGDGLMLWPVSGPRGLVDHAQLPADDLRYVGCDVHGDDLRGSWFSDGVSSGSGDSTRLGASPPSPGPAGRDQPPPLRRGGWGGLTRPCDVSQGKNPPVSPLRKGG